MKHPLQVTVRNMSLSDAARAAIQERADKRQVQSYRRRQRGEVKAHEESPLARVTKLFPIEGYGFLETPDGREVYFHSHSVLHDAYDRLRIGAEVTFVLGEG